MKRMILAAALMALAAPASAQYGRYYDDGYGRYDGRRDGRYGRRGYDRYYEDDQPRRDRGRRDPYAGQSSGPSERPSPGMCVTPRGSCRVAQEQAAGFPCECSTGGSTSRGQIY
jgi:hypothetical protein